MPITLKLPTLLQYQADALCGPERYAVVEGSTKCGKTYPSIIWLLSEHAKCSDNQACWWVAPIFPQAKIAYRRLYQMLSEADPERETWDSNETELRIGLKGHGWIWFKSADNPDSLYGEDVYAVVIDEASRCPDQSWYAVRSTITATGGRVRIIGNVKGRKNWAYNLARRAQAGEPDMSYAKITAADAIEAGLLDPREIEQAERDLPHAVFRELYFCEPSDDAGNPFGLQHISACVGPMGAGPVAAFGVDLARHIDYTVVIGLNKAGAVCYFDRIHKTSWEAIGARITGAVKGTPALADAAGIGDPIVERLQRDCRKLEGFNTASKKRELIEGLIADIQQRKVTIPDGPIRMELESYEYQPTRTGRVGYGAPEGLHDDCVTALALAARRLDADRNVSPVYVSMGEPMNRVAALMDNDAMWSE